MYRNLVVIFCLILVSAIMIGAQASGSEGPADPEAKALTGMSILGNKEAPMSLFIVPWKTSELGAETNLTRTLNERQVPVDRDVFLRELDFYLVSVASKTPAAPAVSSVVSSR
jgi:hypothetical protein